MHPIKQAPQLDINTVAAGGGSRLFFRAGLFVVGPESAGAHPGPVCYKKGGYLAITDANLALGRILPDFFPKIFGPKEVSGGCGTADARHCLVEALCMLCVGLHQQMLYNLDGCISQC